MSLGQKSDTRHDEAEWQSARNHSETVTSYAPRQSNPAAGAPLVVAVPRYGNLFLNTIRLVAR